MAKHKSKDFDNQLKRARKLGCTVISKSSGGGKFIIKSPNGPQYIAHEGERAFHPLRRFLNNLEV